MNRPLCLAAIPAVFAGLVWSGAGKGAGPEVVEKDVFPGEECAFDLKPVKRKAAHYPGLEFRRKQMGYVLLNRTISAKGYVRDIVPLDATSPNFLHSAMRAVQHWTYEVPSTKLHCFPVYNKQVRVGFFADLGKRARIDSTSVKKHIDQLRGRAETGDPIAQYEYARQLNAYKTFEEMLDTIDLDYQAANEWYSKAAKAGLPGAQYQLGINMIHGWDREVNNNGGYKWIKAAAANGYPPAYLLVARNLMREVGRDRTLTAIELLEHGADLGDYPSILLLAWELSTSHLPEIRDGKRAAELLDRDVENYLDEVRVLETKAAAYAAIGDFDEAVDYQDDALDEAEDLGWDIPVMRKRLENYKAKRPWRGRYYPSEESAPEESQTVAHRAETGPAEPEGQ